MQHRSTAAQNAIDVDVTPLLDVVFILLIFFLVTASFNKEAAIDLYVPEKYPADSSPAQVLNIGISSDGSVYFGRERIASSSLASRLRQWRAVEPDGQISVTAEPKSRTRQLVRAVDTIREIGIMMPPIKFASLKDPQ